MSGMPLEEKMNQDIDTHELIENYHTARIAGHDDRHSRMIWACNQYCRKHNGVKSITAYLALDAALQHPEVKGKTALDTPE